MAGLSSMYVIFSSSYPVMTFLFRQPVPGMYGIGKIHLKFKPVKKRGFPFGALFFFSTIFAYLLVYLYGQAWGRTYVIIPLITSTLRSFGALRDVLNPSNVILNGPREQLSISRDHNGIISINASCADDAIFGQGYAHAMDHLHSMEMTRRTALGRLAEIDGEDGLFSDQVARMLDLEGRSRRDLASELPEDVHLLECYAAGVNAYIRSSKLLPIEFYLAGVRSVEPWEPKDSLLILRLHAMWSHSMWHELLVSLAISKACA